MQKTLNMMAEMKCCHEGLAGYIRLLHDVMSVSLSTAVVPSMEKGTC